MAARDFPARMRSSKRRGIMGDRAKGRGTQERNPMQGEGKKAMGFEEAKLVVRRQKRRKSQRKGDEVRVAYLCRYCQHWHVGTQIKVKG